MAFTSHGHHIPGTDYAEPGFEKIECGDFRNCGLCQRQAATVGVIVTVVDSYTATAEQIVRNYIVDEAWENHDAGKLPEDFDTTVVWHHADPEKWEVFVKTNLDEGDLFRVTNTTKERSPRLYVYRMTANIVVTD